MAIVSKSVLRYQHTSSLCYEFLSTPYLRIICGFATRQDVPLESTFSPALYECDSADLGVLVQYVLVEEPISVELIGHVSRDSVDETNERSRKSLAAATTKSAGMTKSRCI